MSIPITLEDFWRVVHQMNINGREHDFCAGCADALTGFHLALVDIFAD